MSGRARKTSTEGKNYVLHLRHPVSAFTFCGRRAADVNCGIGTENEEAICRSCLKKRPPQTNKTGETKP